MNKIISTLNHYKQWVNANIVDKIRIQKEREHEIAINRMIFCAIFGIYFRTLEFVEKDLDLNVINQYLNIQILYSIESIIIVAMLYFYRQPSTFRKLLGSFFDISTITACMVVGGEKFSIGIALYLWTVFGYGFRLGNKYLFFSATMAIAGFSTVIWLNPFWNAHPHLYVAILCALAILPAYAARLIKKISDALKKAEEANQAKDVFIASVSHELRTPLTSIIGLGELLQSTPLTSEQDSMVRTISSAGRSLLRMINSILNFAKTENSENIAATEKVDLYQLLNDVRAMLSVQAKKKDTQLVFEINPTTPKYILGNLRHLEEILINLVGNAVKFTNRGSVRVIIDTAAHKGNEITLRCNIYDTGIGIAADKQEKIFERFTQADDTIIDRFGGSGLGLAITKQLVELYGGKLGVNSALGQGSHFWFEMDVRPAEQEQSMVVDPPSPTTKTLFTDGLVEQVPERPLNILVAEDNITNQKIICKILSLAGHNVSAVDNGERALDALLGQKFDIALMDINMPVMNGLEATRLYHFSEVGHDHTPIIALTADASEQTRRRCLDAGIRAFCTKPIETDRLLAIISQVANSYGSAKPSAEPAIETDPVLAEPVQPPALDPEKLANLTRLAGEDFCNDIIIEYLSESDQLTNSIREAVRANNLADFHGACHALQSCSGNIGATGVVDLMVQSQEIDLSGLKSSGAKIVASLNKELDAVRYTLFNRTEMPTPKRAPAAQALRARAG